MLKENRRVQGRHAGTQGLGLVGRSVLTPLSKEALLHSQDFFFVSALSG